MLLLKAVCPAVVADDVIRVLRASPGTGRISHAGATEVSGSLDIIETEIPDSAAGRLMARLAELDGWEEGDVTLTTVGHVERFQFVNGRAIALPKLDGGQLAQPDSTTLQHLVQVDVNYVLLMMMAALIAAVGLIAGLPMAIVGAMAFSRDLGRLNVMGFAILFREVRLFLRGAGSVAVGMFVAIVFAAIATLVLEATGAATDPLQDIPDRLRDFVSVLDGFTIMVALGAGVAAMLVFISERGTTAVGVGVSITTIPAAAYIGIALAEGAWSDARSGAAVLIVNIVCVLGAEVLTGIILRSHVDRRVGRLQAPNLDGAGPGY